MRSERAKEERACFTRKSREPLIIVLDEEAVSEGFGYDSERLRSMYRRKLYRIELG